MAQAKQYAALPYMFDAGRLKVMLITSRDTGRWVIPKGWPKTGLSPHQLAALEAFEEAGLRGKISNVAVGHFQYRKLMDDGSKVQCDVGVYPLLVESQENDWPQKAERDWKWAELSKAANLVDDSGLADLLREFKPVGSKRRKPK